MVRMLLPKSVRCLIYSPQIKPKAKGGATDVSRNYQAHRHHTAYWRPLQLYDLQADSAEQHNLINPAERAAANLSSAAERGLRTELLQLQDKLRAHLNATQVARECAV